MAKSLALALVNSWTTHYILITIAAIVIITDHTDTTNASQDVSGYSKVDQSISLPHPKYVARQ